MSAAPLAVDAAQAESTPQERPPHTYRWVELILILVAVGISALAYALVGIGTQDTVPANVYEYTGWLLALGLFLHLLTWWRAKYADPIITPVAVLLNGLGLAMIFRIDQTTLGREHPTHAAQNQLIWMTLGCILACVVIFFLRDHRILRRWIYLFGLAGIVLLLLPMVPGLGKEVYGARIWIHIGSNSFQPGEIAKICMAIFFAGYFNTYRDQLTLAGKKILGLRLPRLRDCGPMAIALVCAFAVLVVEKDLGTALLFFGMFVAMLYIATGIKTWIVIGLAAFGAVAFLASRIFTHVQQRVDGWLHALDPEQYDKKVGNSYQLVQGMFGMAQGGLGGTGLGKGRPQIVPFANSDFIYTSLGEELGMVGLFAILVLYLIFVQRGFKTALKLRDGFGSLLAAGLAFAVALQVFTVVGGVTRLIPLTGLTLPFMAAGGSSLIANWIILGLLLRISDSARRPLSELPAGSLRAAPVTSENPIVSERAAARASADSGMLPAVAEDAPGSAAQPGGPWSQAAQAGSGLGDPYGTPDPQEDMATEAFPALRARAQHRLDEQGYEQRGHDQSPAENYDPYSSPQETNPDGGENR
ncbi:FtsW/RodA/SpoVE family cell cycle protein [Brevibacterium sp. 91QC2O2]|uniref:FtsW/RodA/SpoVE family cell cycle protein n=1 Tax=Brevibacterium sp. 91QC2O2 TaxID=2968458 RepID=UPI00211C5269|nr:FtsW/RodA/SpoVE family cell cycle protein [Brevibacterium sp. 91QC2O2]MCQ9369020.1 FtsW/RodA/SpoVE family cell cycle protein [Brevibacterium sp. 91QC2O2]